MPASVWEKLLVSVRVCKDVFFTMTRGMPKVEVFATHEPTEVLRMSFPAEPFKAFRTHRVPYGRSFTVASCELSARFQAVGPKQLCKYRISSLVIFYSVLVRTSCFWAETPFFQRVGLGWLGTSTYLLSIQEVARSRVVYQSHPQILEKGRGERGAQDHHGSHRLDLV
jgi:hypothetical protein